MVGANPLLQLCKQYFSGCDFELLPSDSEEKGFAIADLGPFRVELRLRRDEFSAECSVAWQIPGKNWQAHQPIVCSDRYPEKPFSNEQALAQAAARWREFVVEAGAVVGKTKESTCPLSKHFA